MPGTAECRLYVSGTVLEDWVRSVWCCLVDVGGKQEQPVSVLEIEVWKTVEKASVTFLVVKAVTFHMNA
jgi:hypothetical protein